MTFIASVISKKGVALIADSLVTTSKPLLEFDDFYNYVQSKSSSENDAEITVDTKEVINLFKLKPSHTKDYQEKLFEFDQFTAISTAGAAFLHGKSLEELILIAKTRIGNSQEKSLEKKVEEIKQFFNQEVVDCLKEGEIVRHSVLMVTNYCKDTHITKVFKIFIDHNTPDKLEEEDSEFVTCYEQSENSTVVCEGQNRISERILWGDMFLMYEIIPKIANKIFEDFKITNVPEDYISNLRVQNDVLPEAFYDDIKINKLRELSLQQAIDLAGLLLRIERDIQKYTENIPTVGGNVKTAVIDEGGFRFISGDILRVTNF